jgi:hypothetical protein
MRYVVWLLVAVAGLAIACGGDEEADSGSGSVSGTTEATASATVDGGDDASPTAQASQLPTADPTADPTPADANGAPTEIVPGELPAVAGSVEAIWYQYEGRYVVHYAGMDISGGEALCPGNSIATAAGFEFVSNAPVTDGSCVGAPTLSPTARAYDCDGMLLYHSDIPADTAGTLFGTLEKFAADGAISGVTSQAPSDGAGITEIDLSVCAELP